MGSGKASQTYTLQTITHVRFWVPDKLFSIRTTRDADFRFTAGQFARLGLARTGLAQTAGQMPSTTKADAAAAGDVAAGKVAAEKAPHLVPEPDASLLWRAYSMVNAPHEDGLEFYSIVVPHGQFSPLLAQARVGDKLYIDKTAFGFLTLERFAAGGTLWLLATGTGLSAFLSILQDGQTWQRFERVILVHGVRTGAELAYADTVQTWVQQRGGKKTGRLVYLPIPTRGAGPQFSWLSASGLPALPQARITQLLADGRLAQLADCPLEPQTSKVMLCGNPDMIRDTRALLQERGFAAGRRGNPGTLAVENYW